MASINDLEASPEDGVEGRETSSPTPYTVFTPATRRFIEVLIATATLTSPITATIYLPLLPLLQRHFHTSAQAINLTITLYLVFQAIAPLFISGFSDHLGRRPIYLGTLALYTVASIGLAINTSNYAVLLVLRALQSLGASALLPVTYGTVADICTSAERGKVLGPVMAAGNLGTGIGPIVGGWIALGSGGFRWAFWGLVIFGSLMLSAFIILMPETARNVVGNGSVQDNRWNRSLWSNLVSGQSQQGRGKLCSKSRSGVDASRDDEKVDGHGTRDRDASLQPRRRVKFRSPLASIRIMFYQDTSLILWISSSSYALWYCIQATIPSTYKSPPYNFNELQVGLAYLPGCAGVMLSMYLAGKIMDWNYKVIAGRAGFTIDKVAGDDLAKFPIEHARSRGSAHLFVLSFATMIGYGWSIARHVHVAVPLMLQCLHGFLMTWFSQSFSTLLVDIFPETPSTASAAGNIARCALSAVAVAVLQLLIDAIGKGWVFSLLGLLSGGGGLIAMVALRKWGMNWRRIRREKPAQKRERKERSQMKEGGRRSGRDTPCICPGGRKQMDCEAQRAVVPDGKV